MAEGIHLMAQSNRETMESLWRLHSLMLPDGRANPEYVGPPDVYHGRQSSSCPGCGAPVQGSGCDYCGRGRVRGVDPVKESQSVAVRMQNGTFAWPTPPDALDIRGDG